MDLCVADSASAVTPRKLASLSFIHLEQYVHQTHQVIIGILVQASDVMVCFTTYFLPIQIGLGLCPING
ncbi:hypothetical protein GW17_00059804 [Ensete ventricosum]|nr:hypothetical protein GW17_00059804 [Ensete ventricosum]